MMLSRRKILLPVTAALIAPTLRADAHNPNAFQHPPVAPNSGPLPEARDAPAAPLPDRYDEPLGISLENWPYPAPVRFQQCMAAGQAVRMAYMDIAPTGRANGRTVVLLHGKNFDSSYWAGPIKDLAAAGFRVVVPDQVGFNKSSKPDISYSFDMLAELTVNLLGSLRIGQASIIGHSTGGMLAVRIAASFPKKVERLILEDPIGLVDYRRYIPPQSLETLILAEYRRTVSAYRAFVRTYFPILPAIEMERFVEWRMRIAQSGEYDRFCRATALTYQMIYREPVRDEYDAIDAPTLIIVGEKDKAAPLLHYASPDMAAKMPTIPQAAIDAAKDVPKGKLVVVPGVGHVPHLEAPDRFRTETVGFLGA